MITRIHGLLAAVLLGLAVYGWRQSRELDELQARSVLASQVESAKGKVAAATRRARATEAGQTTWARVAVDLTDSRPVTYETFGMTTGARAATEEERRRIEADHSPEAAILQAVRDQREIRVRYGRLLRKLELDSAAEEKLIGIFRERKQVPEQANYGIGRVETLLGPKRFALFESYETHLGAELLTAQMEQTCALLNDPLTSAQADALAEVFAQNGVPPKDALGTVAPVLSPNAVINAGRYKFVMLRPNDGFVDSSGAIAVNYPITPAAAAKSAGILSASQRAVFEAIQRQQAAEREIAARFHYTR